MTPHPIPTLPPVASRPDRSRLPAGVRFELECCWMLVYRSPVEELSEALPAGLEPYTRGGFAFWSFAVCQGTLRRRRGEPGQGGRRCHLASSQIHLSDRAPGRFYRLEAFGDRTVCAALAPPSETLHWRPVTVALHDEGCRRTSLQLGSPSGRQVADVLIDESKRAELAWDSPFSTVKEACAELAGGTPPCPGLGHPRVPAHWKPYPVSVPFAHLDLSDTFPAEPELATRITLA